MCNDFFLKVFPLEHNYQACYKLHSSYYDPSFFLFASPWQTEFQGALETKLFEELLLYPLVSLKDNYVTRKEIAAGKVAVFYLS